MALSKFVLLPSKQKKTLARKPPKKKEGDKNLSFASCSPEIRNGLRKSRATEWQKWKQCNAGVIISKGKLQELLDAGVKVNPMQWIKADRNAHERRDDRSYSSSIDQDLKRRLVGWWNFVTWTVSFDAQNLVFTWRASQRIKLRSADIFERLPSRQAE